MEHSYKEQLIIENKNGVTFYLFDEDGEVNAHSAQSVEKAKQRIDAILRSQGGYYNCDGELVPEPENGTPQNPKRINVLTLVFERAGCINGLSAETRVSRSFVGPVNDEIIACIKGIIAEDFEDDYATDKERESHFVLDAETLKGLNAEYDEDFDRGGILLWEDSNDEEDIFRYVLHQSICELPYE